MSLKLDAFRAINTAPKTADKFYILLPGLSQSLYKVSAASLPFATMTEGAIWYLGQQFWVPTSRVESGQWSCTLLEDMTLTGALGISALERRVTNQRVYLGDILIFVTDQFTGILPQNVTTLRYSWLIGAEPVNLAWNGPTEATTYKLKFRYNSIRRWY